MEPFVLPDGIGGRYTITPLESGAGVGILVVYEREREFLGLPQHPPEVVFIKAYPMIPSLETLCSDIRSSGHGWLASVLEFGEKHMGLK
ncbi:MAG TPA: hypothetical protein GX517_08780 [Alicyclobacillus sp.]|nr:hypothetical protein [Alicyclobacillus sp.]